MGPFVVAVFSAFSRDIEPSAPDRDELAGCHLALPRDRAAGAEQPADYTELHALEKIAQTLDFLVAVDRVLLPGIAVGARLREQVEENLCFLFHQLFPPYPPRPSAPTPYAAR